ncbi:hypothetical protein [Chryseobacterium indoltheticum]|uniref:Uncharacterized protein n=1 Tax=Chryseobacterium indoltheticum TaxID=254 RepID=A0A381F808_9FLAO|nr:hypothetical protein [Chryseobacterium indoltheticum]SUX42709.1 Uncharacterised protein [Chryseobacterium indoltheticum]
MKKLFIPLFLLILINCNKSGNPQEIKSDLVEIISEDKVMDINASPAQEIPVDAMVSAKLSIQNQNLLHYKVILLLLKKLSKMAILIFRWVILKKHINKSMKL